MCEPIGMVEMAERLGVKQNTAAIWKVRGLLPQPRWLVSGNPAWDWRKDIKPWAIKTGRLQTE